MKVLFIFRFKTNKRSGKVNQIQGNYKQSGWKIQFVTTAN